MELYKLKKGGGVSYFSVTLFKTLVMKYGTYGGKLTEKTVNRGRKYLMAVKKNKLKELYSKGYKTIQEYRDKCSGVIEIEDIPKHFKFNFNRNRTTLPKQAKTYKEVTIKYPRLIQAKLDGIRCISLKHEGKYIMISRTGEYFNLPYLLNEVKPLIDEFGILDGELYVHGMEQSEISGIARRHMPDMFGVQLQYHLYDLGSVSHNNIRVLNLNMIRKSNISKLIKVLASDVVQSHKDVMQFHDMYVEAGYEGAILRNITGNYEFGFRSDNLLKVKVYLDSEFELIGFNIKNNDIDTLNGVFITEEGKEFKVKLKGTREERKRQYDDIFVGNYFTVRYLNLSVNNIPEKAQVNLLISKR